MNTIILNGSPISVINTDFTLTAEEKKCILDLNYVVHNNNEKVKLSEDTNILKKKELKRIDELMFYWVNEYNNKILEIKNKLRLVHSWSTINDNSFHPLHMHPNSFISCVFYLESQGSNKICFETHKSLLQSCYNFDYDIIKNNGFNSKNWTFDINQGMIIFFLSNLHHHSFNSGRKILIGSNYFITGKLGSHKRLTYLEI